MPAATSYSYSSYYYPSHHYSSLPYPDSVPLSPQDYPMSHHDHISMQPPSSPGIPIDPALALYPPYYSSYQQSSHHLPQHLSLPASYSSPSSQGSDTIGTPPAEHMFPPSSSNMNGKRPASSISTNSDSRKKARKDEDPDARSLTAEKDEKAKPTRGSRACTVCRRLKMKCVGAEHGPPCKRCQTGNHECIFEESNRGKRSSKKHELLTRSLRKMERTLDTVLRSIGNPTIASGMISRSPSPTTPQSSTTRALLAASPSPPQSSTLFPTHSIGSPKLHSLPDNSLNPLGLLAEASLANRRAHAHYPSGMVARPTHPEDMKLGVASDSYFKPGPMTILPLRRLFIERQVQPEMLSFVSTDEVVELFNLFFDHMNMHCNLLDRDFHTPSLVCSRSPFLLTTICAIASKFYEAKPELHLRLTELAKKLAFSVPAKGYKSVEIVQAYLLLTLWGCGAVERYEQDTTWLLLGMAIRMGTDLNLHRKTAVASQDTQEGRARDLEVHNRERTWLLCFCLDRSYSAQMGKPHSIKEDYIIRNVDEWCLLPTANWADPSLAAYCDLQRIVSRSLDFLYAGTDTPSGLQSSCDYVLIIKTFEAQILASAKRWRMIMEPNQRDPPHVLEYRKLISQFYLNYHMLVINSFGLQNALERNPIDIGHFFARCHSSAMTCATIIRDQLGPSGYMRYSPDSHCVLTSYAVLSLLKLVRPEFAAYLDDEQNTIQLVRDVADVLDNISANPHHTPALYSGFLRALISAKVDGEPRKTTPSPPRNGNDLQNAFNDPTFDDSTFLLNEFQFNSEMGPVVDMSTFPPTMATNTSSDDGGFKMDNILSNAFWDSVIVPGYNSMEGISGGFVFGPGGSGLITPRLGLTPSASGANSPLTGIMPSTDLAQFSAAFDGSQEGLLRKLES
ncbi:fungal-specific transcription factor domain-containing protein [Mycena floridula]|nr:fungal-specific transcription factor domain-containing protein [Mycena floridula]